jgi:hypothetical protein
MKMMRDPGLTGHGARQQRLAGARGAVEQDALRDAGAECLELLGVLEELLDLVQLLDRLVDARDVAEGDLGRVHRQPLGARLAEGHDLRAPALDLVHEEDPEPDEDQERQHVGQQRQDHAGPGGLDVEVPDQALCLGRAQLRDQDVGVVDRVADLVLVLVRPLEAHVDRVVLRAQRGALDLPVLDLLEEARERPRSGLVLPLDELGGEERQHDHDQDREGSALEEAAHEGQGYQGVSGVPAGECARKARFLETGYSRSAAT